MSAHVAVVRKAVFFAKTSNIFQLTLQSQANNGEWQKPCDVSTSYFDRVMSEREFLATKAKQLEKQRREGNEAVEGKDKVEVIEGEEGRNTTKIHGNRNDSDANHRKEPDVSEHDTGSDHSNKEEN